VLEDRCLELWFKDMLRGVGGSTIGCPAIAVLSILLEATLPSSEKKCWDCTLGVVLFGAV
jgi:hypothetical protein